MARNFACVHQHDVMLRNPPQLLPHPHAPQSPGSANCWYGISTTPFGDWLLAGYETVIVLASFDPPPAAQLPAWLQLRHPDSRWIANPARAHDLSNRIFIAVENPLQLQLSPTGTAFQLRVWQATLSIPAGESRSYTQVAHAIGMPKAARAVGHALAANPVAVLIPCHRVVPASKSTGTGNYRWGSHRKHALLTWELQHK